MKILKIILFSLLGVIALVFIISLFLPSEVHVERSMTMKAPAKVVFEQVNNLENWEKWSPWLNIDPDIELSYTDVKEGKGASYSWKSNHKQVGNGSLTITDSKPYEFVANKMDFEGEGTATGHFDIEEVEDGVKVTWSFDTDMGSNPIAKFFGLMMDDMVGADFEKGLTKIKELAESAPADMPTELKIEKTTVAEQMAVTIEKNGVTMQNVSQELGMMYGMIDKYMKANKLEAAGAPFAIYKNYTPESFDMEAGIPVKQMDESKVGSTSSSGIKMVRMPQSNVVLAHHYGSYASMENTYNALDQWIKDNNEEIAGNPVEIYFSDPMTEKDTTKWYTQVYFPVK